MKTKNAMIFVFTAMAFFGLTVYNYFLRTENASLKASLPCLIKGDKIDNFILTGTDGSAVDTMDINSLKDRFVCIFIFERPCSQCNKNINFWNKLQTICGNEIQTYGIILDGRDQAVNFANTSAVKFKIFTPLYHDTFIKSMNIKTNLPQTILYKNGKVVYIKLGELLTEDFLIIKNMLKAS